MPAAHRTTPKPLAFALLANSAASAGVRCADRMCASKGISSALSWAHAPFTTGQSLSEPMITATLRIIFRASLSLFPASANKKGCDAPTPRPSELAASATSSHTKLHGFPELPSRTGGDRFRAAFPAFRTPPKFSWDQLFHPLRQRLSRGRRPSDRYSLRQKSGFAKGVWAISPLCSLAPKNFQKFCAVSTLIFFLSMTYLLNVI